MNKFIIIVTFKITFENEEDNLFKTSGKTPEGVLKEGKIYQFSSILQLSFLTNTLENSEW
jgi:hypothetical protein